MVQSTMGLLAPVLPALLLLLLQLGSFETWQASCGRLAKSAQSSDAADPARSASCASLADLCQCQQANSDGTASLARLDCSPSELGALTMALGAQTNQQAPVRAHFMQVSAGLSPTAAGALAKHHQPPPPARPLVVPSLQVKHLALQLKLEPDTRRRAPVGRQLADFLQLLDSSQLQSLSIMLDSDVGSGRHHEAGPLELASLLQPFSKLTRFELSSSVDAGSPRIHSGSFAGQTRLKSLNLASNYRVEFAAHEQLGLSKELEHLNFESSGLTSFNLLELLASPFEPADIVDSELAASFAGQNASYLGQPNLVSLNLASNGLRSLERHLFAGFREGSQASRPTYSSLVDGSDRIFVLASLSQLDLSRNQLAEFSVQAGQLVQCTMPNLAQLYLQHNRLLHVNLNSLLQLPFAGPSSFRDPSQLWASQASYQTSKLEHIDLSWNRLLAVSLVERPASPPASQSAARRPARSIQLNGNHLRSPLLWLPLEWAKRMLYAESLVFAGKEPSDLLNVLDLIEHSASLEFAIRLANESSSEPASLCDLLALADDRELVDLQHQQQLGLELQLAQNGLAEIRRAHFASAKCKAIQIVRLQMNRIAAIEEASFAAMSYLEQLDLSANLLARLAEQTFAANGRLRWLNLADNQLESLPSSVFASLRQLEWLSLKANKLASLPAGLLKSQLSLKSLDLAGNKLDTTSWLGATGRIGLNQAGEQPLLPPPAAKRAQTNASNKTRTTKSKRRQARHLQPPGSPDEHLFEASGGEQTALLLASNRLQAFELDTCTSFAKQVQLLQLSSNKLSAVYAATFRCFEAVQTLHLDTNRLESIESGAFGSLQHLQHLDLSHNQLVRFAANPPSGLQHLGLASNRLTALDLQGLSSAKQLEHLDVSNNTRLRLDVADLCSLLTQLTLIRRLELSKLEAIFSGDEQKSAALLTERLQLESVKLSYCPQVDEFLFGFLSNHLVGIESLQLDGTGILLGPSSNRLASMLLNRVQNELLELDLAANELASQTFIASLRNFSLIVQPIQLRKLNLSHNKLKVWPFDERAPNSVLVSLQYLNLSDNKLETFVSGQQEKAFEFAQLESLDLSSNRIVELLDLDTSSRASFQLARLMPKLRHLDVSRNQISVLPAQFLQNLDELRWLELSGNPLLALPARMLPSVGPTSLKLSLRGDFELPSSAIDTGIGDQQEQLQEAATAELVLFRSAGSHELDCQSVDNFAKYQIRLELEQAGHVSDLESRCEACKRLLEATDRLELESSSLLQASSLIADLGSNSWRLFSLKLNPNKLARSDREGEWLLASRLLELDLSGGGLGELPAKGLCRASQTSLMSLSLSRNRLKRLPEGLLINCRLLSHLDLGHNRISSLGGGWLAGTLGRSSGLLALSLGHNSIKELASIDLEVLGSLRFLDLRHNQIRISSHLEPLLRGLLRRNAYLLGAAILESHSLVDANEPRTNHSTSPLGARKQAGPSLQVQLDAKSLRLSSRPHLEAGSHSPFMLSQVQPSGLEGGHLTVAVNQTVKFCSLKWRSAAGKLCPINIGIDNRADPDSSSDSAPDSSGRLKCLYLRLPADEPSCLTDLRDQAQAQLAGANSSLKRLESAQTTRRSNSEPATEDDEHQSDPVLTVIEQLKTKWLQLKQYDLRAHLAALSQIRGDQIWMEVNGMAIHSLTLLKLAVVGGSTCILALLLIAFVLLSRKQPADGKPARRAATAGRSRNSDQSDRLDGDLSISTSANSCSQSSAGTKSTRSRDGTATESACSQSRTSTAIYAPQSRQARASPPPHQTPISLDAGQLAACSTPSSSLGPSSVETGETMQAIESIHSGASGATLVACNDAGHEPGCCARGEPTANQQPRQHLATVTRLVKSSSTNFENSLMRAGGHLVGPLGQTNRAEEGESRYATLRTRLRPSIDQSRTRQPIYYQQASPSMSMEQPDPTTLSLLSISSALSNSNYQRLVQHDQQPLYGHRHNPESSASHLCQFHQLASGTRLQPNDVILEQEEQQLMNNQQGYPLRVEGADFEASETHFPPPPPASLVIECLENEHMRYFPPANRH